MTAAKLVAPRALRDPEGVAPYFRFGAEYVLEVADDMGWEHDGLDETTESAYEAMSDGRTDVPDEEAKLIGAVLLRKSHKAVFHGFRAGSMTKGAVPAIIRRPKIMTY